MRGGVDKAARFCWSGEVKFLPTLSALALPGLAVLSLAACSTPANRRELYNTNSANGPWHDYERRLDASEETGVAPGDMGRAAGPGPEGTASPVGGTTVVRGSRPIPQPKSAPLTPDPTALPSNAPVPGATGPAPAPATVPAPADVPSSPTTTDPSAPAAPGGATTAPPADPATPPNPPTT